MSDAPVQTQGGLESQPPLPVRRLHNFIYCPRCCLPEIVHAQTTSFDDALERPLACRHFWWLPFWLIIAKPCLRRTRTTSLLLQTGKRSLTSAPLPKPLLRRELNPAMARTTIPTLLSRCGRLPPRYRPRKHNRAVQERRRPSVWFQGRVPLPAEVSCSKP